MINAKIGSRVSFTTRVNQWYGEVVNLYTANVEGFRLPMAAVLCQDGKTRYVLKGDLLWDQVLTEHADGFKITQCMVDAEVERTERAVATRPVTLPPMSASQRFAWGQAGTNEFA